MSDTSSELYTLDDLSECSPALVNDDLRPTRLDERTWNRWHIASLWVGMSVCIPTYMLASSMITGGLSWVETISIILLGNIIVAIPMTLNGHAGTRYGIPFPVLGRATFGTVGVHIPSIIRALVACAWFGIQTWVGGLAIASIYGVLMSDPTLSKSFPIQFTGFILFWAIQMFFVWRGTESIKWLETLAAPLLIIFGVFMLAWGVDQGGGISKVLSASAQFAQPTLSVTTTDTQASVRLNLIKDQEGKPRAQVWRYVFSDQKESDAKKLLENSPYQSLRPEVLSGEASVTLNFKAQKGLKLYAQFANRTETIASDRLASASVKVNDSGGTSNQFVTYLLWLTAMVAFWATLALNISDITRYASSQRDQVVGQFLGLPTTMTLYAFIGVAVTCAAVVIFDRILIVQDAPWEPATLINYFSDQPMLVLFAQLMILIATISTNIAANVISPANSFANLAPKTISFRTGGVIAGVIGLFTIPWLLMNTIAGFLITYGSVLGPVVAVLIADYYFVHNKNLKLKELYQEKGAYTYSGGYHITAFVSLAAGIIVVFTSSMNDHWKILYDTGWFSGFLISFTLYLLLTRFKPSAST